MEQLTQQDLNSDSKQMGDEVDNATRDAKGGQSYAAPRAVGV